MKAQTYYRCGNCGRIAAIDAGDRHTACTDCGSGNLKVLVPVDDDAHADPLSGRKKTALALVIGLVVVAVLAVFLIFGRLLQGYIEYNTKHQAAERASERLATEIEEKEATLVRLGKRATEEKALAIDGARQTEAAVSSAKATLGETENALHRTRVALTNETAKVLGIRVDLAQLEEERSQLRRRVDALAAEEAQLAAIARAAAVRTNRLAAEVAAAEKMQTAANGEMTRAVGAVETANAARDKAREQAETLLARVAALTARRESLEQEVLERQKLQGLLESSITEMKKQHSMLLSEASKVRAALDSLMADRDKAHHEADVQSARAAALKAEVAALERVRANPEKTKGEIGK
jgi:chromosome segregation ATPase/DNA-directed RNA polymerase subunit RPC12/RpoP